MADLKQKFEKIFKKQKNPKELVISIRDSLDFLGPSALTLSNNLENNNSNSPTNNNSNNISSSNASYSNNSDDALKPDDPKRQKILDELSKNLQEMKVILYGDGHEAQPNAEQCTQLSHEAYRVDLLLALIDHIAQLDFESRKTVTSIFNNLLRRQSSSRYPTVEYICRNTIVLEMLLDGYARFEISLQCGSMIRECAKFEALAREIIYSPRFVKFFSYVDQSNFEIATDANATFKELLSKHKTIVSEYLEKNFDEFFGLYKNLLESNNYVTRRQSLKLLGEILLDRSNYNIMTRYISKPENLKLMMILLRDGSKSIQFEAFHVFKVFAANPNKIQPVKDILFMNRDKLVDYLTNFQTEKEDDQFKEEKNHIIKEIQNL